MPTKVCHNYSCKRDASLQEIHPFVDLYNSAALITETL